LWRGRSRGLSSPRPLPAWSRTPFGAAASPGGQTIAGVRVPCFRAMAVPLADEGLGEQECARCHQRADCYARAYENRPLEQAHKETWPLRRQRGVSPVLDRSKSPLPAPAPGRAARVVSTRRCRGVRGRVGFPVLRSGASIAPIAVVSLVVLRRASHKRRPLPQLCRRSRRWRRSVAPGTTWLCLPPRC
jgi:hypothetical protein